MAERACTNTNPKHQPYEAEIVRDFVNKFDQHVVYVTLRCTECQRPRGERRKVLTP